MTYPETRAEDAALAIFVFSFSCRSLGQLAIGSATAGSTSSQHHRGLPHGVEVSESLSFILLFGGGEKGGEESEAGGRGREGGGSVSVENRVGQEKNIANINPASEA